MSATPAEDEDREPPAVLDAEDCETILDHVSQFLGSDQTDEDAERMRSSLAEVDPELGEGDVDDLIRRLVRRSCAEQAPEQLRSRICAEIAALRARES